MQEEPAITGGAFSDVKDQTSPFGFQKCEGVDLGAGEPEWIVNRDRVKWDAIFESLKQICFQHLWMCEEFVSYYYLHHRYYLCQRQLSTHRLPTVDCQPPIMMQQ